MFKIKTPVAWQIYDNIVYIFDDKNRTTYTLDGTGLLIWKCIAAGYTLTDIFKTVAEAYMIDVELIKEDVVEFIEELKGCDLLEVVE